MPEQAPIAGAYHPLLQRQLRRARVPLDGSPIPFDTLNELLRRVTESYKAAEDDRYLLERSLDLSSREMQALNVRLESERTRLTTLLATTEDCVCTLDADGWLTWGNPASLHLLGLQADNLVPFHFFDYVRDLEDDEADTPNWNSRHRRAILRDHNGRELPISYIQNEIVDAGCSPSSVVVFRDITVECAREQALRAAREDANKASRLKGELLANVSHEVRTPLHGILGMAQVMLLEGDLNVEQKSCLENLKSSAEGLLCVLNDILDMSKIESGKMTLESVAFQPEDVLKEVQQLLACQARAKNLVLKRTVVSASQSTVLGDPNRLRQILLNLASNAVKFTDSGFVELSLTRDDGPDRTARLQFHVRDTGIGIPREKHGEIFEAFAQADGSITRRFGGTGLGLAICSQLLRLMNSEPKLESKPGLGSDFSFELLLPLASLATPEANLPESAGVPPLHILYAEDNPINQLTARKLLTAHGHSVQVVANGTAAVEAASTTCFDVILMDHQMPDLSGIEASARIRALGLQIPIIAVSADAMLEDRKRFLAAGMDGFVGKPFRIADLQAEIARVLSLQAA